MGGECGVRHIAINSIGPLWLNALRWGLAILILLPLGWRVLVMAPARAARCASAGPMSVSSARSASAPTTACSMLALRTSTPVNVTLIASSLPLWSMLVGVIGYRVHPTRQQLLGAVLSLGGVLTVLSRAATRLCAVAHPAGGG